MNQAMMRRLAVIFALLLVALIFAGLIRDYSEQAALRPLAEAYVKSVPQDLGAPNVITGILLTFRAFDTLGEVAVLFMVAAGVGLVLSGGGGAPDTDREERKPASELVQSGADILLPLIFIFAAYIIMNGHLSAGGGFQGGAVIASGVMLLLLAKPATKLAQDFLSFSESLAGVLFVLVGVAGLIFAGGFLDNRVLPLGQFGAFFSAGAIPVISILLGIKVGAELSVIIDRFRN
jgi:multicomponent Na+:H+ antiporter subunit B